MTHWTLSSIEHVRMAHLVVVPPQTELLRRCAARRCAAHRIHSDSRTIRARAAGLAVNRVFVCVVFTAMRGNWCVQFGVCLCVPCVHSALFWSTENTFSSVSGGRWHWHVARIQRAFIVH